MQQGCQDQAIQGLGSSCALYSLMGWETGLGIPPPQGPHLQSGTHLIRTCVGSGRPYCSTWHIVGARGEVMLEHPEETRAEWGEGGCGGG